MSPIYRLLLPCCAVALLFTSVHAAQLRLKNGEILKGEVLNKTNGVLVFRSEMLGEIRIAEDKVASLGDSTTGGAEQVAQNGAQGSATPGATGQTRPQSAMRLRNIIRETKGLIEYGLNDQTGRRKSIDFALRGEAEYTHDVDNFRVNGRYIYEHSNGTVNTDHREASFRWRHSYTPEYFFQSTTGYSDDTIKMIDLNLEQSLGLGWAAYRKKSQTLNLGAGATSQYRKAQGFDAGTVVLGDIFQDYSIKLNERFSFQQEASAQYSPVSRVTYTILNGQMIRTNEEAANYRYKFNASLKSKISEHLTLSLRYDFEYDNTIGVDSLRADQRISSTVGYGF